MAADNEAQVIISADSSKFNSGMDAAAQKARQVNQEITNSFREMSRQVTSEVQKVHEQTKSNFDKISSSFAGVQKAFMAFAAVAAGGAAFKSAVDKSVELTKESMKLSKALGISATEASVLNVALGDAYTNSDTMLAALGKMTKQLNSNEAAFTNLGVATRDVNGNYKNSLDIMLDVNKRLLEFKEGTDRNIEGTKIYGKSWGEVAPILRLNSDLMTESKKKAEELGLVVGQENVEATSRYRAAMNDVGDVMDAVKKAVGDALLPILTDLANWFAEVGPYAVKAFKGAIGGVAALFWGLKFAVESVWEFLKLAIRNMVVSLLTLADVAAKALSGDFSGAKASWKNGMAQIKNNASTAMDEIAKKAQITQEKLWNLFADPTATAKKTGGKNSTSSGDATTGSSTKDKSRMSEFEATLSAQKDAYEKQKLAQGSFQEYSKESERDYWKRILDTVRLSREERLAVEQKYYGLERDIRKKAFDAEIEEMKSKSAAYKQGSVDRIQIAGEMASKIGEKYGIESKEYKAALGEMANMGRERAAQQRQLDDMALERSRQHNQSMLDLERERLNLSQQMGDITEVQHIQSLRNLKEQEFQIELQSMQDKVALYDLDSIAYQQHLDKIAALKEKHDLEMKVISTQANAAQKKELDKFVDPIAGAFEKSVNGMIAGTLTFKKAMSQMMQSIALEFANMGVKMVVNWAKNEIMKTQASAAGAAARGVVETTAATQSAAISGGMAIKNILNKAAEAMASVYSSIAAIPYVGPFLAPVMAAGAFGVVAGYAGRIMSAEGGYDIPAGMNPMTQLHQKEMVLPAKHADVIRNLADGGGGATSQPVSVHINAVDSAGVKRLFMDHGSALADALRGQMRNFKPVK